MNKNKLYLFKSKYYEHNIGIINVSDHLHGTIDEVQKNSKNNDVCPLMIIKENSDNDLKENEKNIIIDLFNNLAIPSVYVYSKNEKKIEDSIDSIIIENNFSFKKSVILTFGSENLNEAIEDFLLLSGPSDPKYSIGLYLIVYFGDSLDNKNKMSAFDSFLQLFKRIIKSIQP